MYKEIDKNIMKEFINISNLLGEIFNNKEFQLN